jgi:hypothetical protein
VIGPVVFAPGNQTCATELKKWSISNFLLEKRMLLGSYKVILIPKQANFTPLTGSGPEQHLKPTDVYFLSQKLVYATCT